MDTTFNTMQTVKRRFFALRNGIIADSLRKGGASYKIIFGLNLPQISEIASEMPKDAALARILWDNSSTRESRMLAPMLFPPEEIDAATALRWASEVNEREIADILCLKLLKKLPYALWLVAEINRRPTPLAAYTAMRLSLNLLPEGIEQARNLADSHASTPGLARLARQISEEISYLTE